MPNNQEDKTQKLFGELFRHLLQGELPTMMTEKTAGLIIAILRVVMEILRVVFPGKTRRPRKQVGSPPKS